MEKKKGLSIAVMLSIIGILGLTFCTAMGLLLDGRPMAEALALGAGVLIVGSLGLYLAVKAKTVENEFAKWRKFEYLGLAMCVAAIAFAAQPTIYAANFVFSNRSLRDAGDRDIELVSGMMSRFKSQEADRLNITREGLENYLAFKPSQVSSSLGNFIRYDVMHGLQEELFGKYDNELSQLADQLSGFDFANFPTMASRLTALSDSVGANLTALSRNFSFGNIGFDHSGEYAFTPSEPYVYADRAVDFGNEYAAMFSPRAGSVALFGALALLFILDYILEFRSLRVPVGAGPKISDKDGIPL